VSGDKTIWDTLENIPREILYGVLLIVFIIPMVFPLGLPVPISANIEKWYETIDALPPGSTVMIDFGYSGGGEPELGPMAVAVYHQLFEKGDIKIIAMSTSIEGPQLWDKAIAEINPVGKYGAEYGVDYIHIGYIAGTETAMAAIGKDLRATTSTDYHGDSLDQYPIMDGIVDAESFDLLLCFTTGGDQSEGWVRQWVTVYGTEYMCSVLAMMVPTMLPYQEAGQIISVTAGAQAGEMESLIHVPARGIKSADVITLTHILLIGYVIIGNVAAFMKKSQGGGR